MAEIVFRHAVTGTDLQAIRQLCHEYAVALGVDLETQNFAQELADLPGKYGPPLGRLLLAVVDNVPAGCIAIRPLPDDACEMKRLFVRPQFRSLGIGRRLIEALIKEAQHLGYRAMRLDTIPDQMPSAVALYASFGFRPIPAYWDNPLPGVEYMELRLDGNFISPNKESP